MMNMKHWIWFLILIPMMNRSERYQKYSDYTMAQAVNTGIGWMQLLETMAHNSKRTTQELLFIHFQRPEARNCKTYQEWINSAYLHQNQSCMMCMRVMQMWMLH